MKICNFRSLKKIVSDKYLTFNFLNILENTYLIMFFNEPKFHVLFIGVRMCQFFSRGQKVPVRYESEHFLPPRKKLTDSKV
jgi:hypothetical protein